MLANKARSAKCKFLFTIICALFGAEAFASKLDCSKEHLVNQETTSLEKALDSYKENPSINPQDLGLLALKAFGKIIYLPNRYLISYSPKSLGFSGFRRGLNECSSINRIVFLRGQINVGNTPDCELCEADNSGRLNTVARELKNSNITVKKLIDESNETISTVFYDDQSYIQITDDNENLPSQIEAQILMQGR